MKMVAQTDGVHGKTSQAFPKVLQLLEELSTTSFANDGERTQALLATYALMSRLETPWETILRLCIGQVEFGS